MTHPIAALAAAAASIAADPIAGLDLTRRPVDQQQQPCPCCTCESDR